MKHLVLLLLFASSLLAQQKKTIFTVTIKNCVSDSLMITEDLYNFAVVAYRDSADTFEFDLQIVPSIYELTDFKNTTWLFLKPGFSLNMKADAQHFEESITYNGTGAVENNFLAKYSLAEATYSKTASLLIDNPKAFKSQLDEYVKKSQRWLNSLSNPDVEFTMVMKRYIELKKRLMLILLHYNEMYGMTAPGFKYEKYQDETATLDDFKGKYIYINIWATTCARCIRQIRPLESLIRRYRNKNIAFVNISVDSKKNINVWKDCIKDRGLHGIHLLAGNSFESEFFEKLDITSTSRYILIDPQGKIVTPTAPRPDSPQLEEMLNTLLKE
ncbi:MAG: TlpA disulfide reductase family protein [Bacteroidota bacterium]